VPKIVITDPADSDLDAIFDYYGPLVGEDHANAIIVQILEQLELLEAFPGMGRPSLKPDVREVVITRYPFLAPYRVVNDEIQILRVVHQRAEHPSDW
jgi:plasmid stabilization system protein ParE